MATNATLALSLIVAVAGAILVILGFAGRRNELTPRQVRKRQRLVRRSKGGKR